MVFPSPSGLHRRCVQLEHRSRLLEQRLQQSDKEKAQFVRSAEELKRDRDSMGSRQRSLSQELLVLRQQLQEATAAQADVVRREAVEEDLRRALNEGAERMSAAEEEAETLRRRVAELSSAVRDRDAEIKRHIDTRMKVAAAAQRTDAAPAGAQRAPKDLRRRHDASSPPVPQRSLDVQEAGPTRRTPPSSGPRARRPPPPPPRDDDSASSPPRLDTAPAFAAAAARAASPPLGAPTAALQPSSVELQFLEEEVSRLTGLLASAQERDAAFRAELLDALSRAERRDADVAACAEGFRTAPADPTVLRRLERVAADVASGAKAEAAAARAECTRLLRQVEDYEGDREATRSKFARMLTSLQQLRESADEQRRADRDEILSLNSENREVLVVYEHVCRKRDELQVRNTVMEDEVARLKEASAAAVEMHASQLSQLRTLVKSELQQQHSDALAAMRRADDERRAGMKDKECITDRPADPPEAGGGWAERQKELLDELQRREDEIAALKAQGEGRERELSEVRRSLGDAKRLLSQREDELRARRDEGAAPAAAAEPEAAPAAAPAAGESRLEALLQCLASPQQHDDVPSGLLLQNLPEMCVGLRETAELARRTTVYLAAKRQVPIAPLPHLPSLPGPGDHAGWWDAGMVYLSDLANSVRVTQSEVAFMAATCEMMRRGVHAADAEGAQMPDIASPQPTAAPPHPAAVPHPAAAPQPPPSMPREPVDDATEDASSNGFGRCSEMITDSDALLRAAQGEAPFWGDGRIQSLRRELESLERPDGEGELQVGPPYDRPEHPM